MRSIPFIVIALAIPITGLAQPFVAMGVGGKLNYEIKQSLGPMALVGDAAYAAILQETNTPAGWGQGGSAYGKRFGVTAACSSIHSALAFGLDSSMHEDPRYFRAGDGGFWRRTGHAVRGTIFTRTDEGGETLSFWRLGSDYGAAYVADLWYPGRVDTVRLGFSEGSLQLGFDLASNLAAEFWPDLKRKMPRFKR